MTDLEPGSHPAPRGSSEPRDARGGAERSPANVTHCIHGLGLGGAQKVIASIIRGRHPESYRHFVYSCSDGVLREEVERAGGTVRIVPRTLPRLDPLWVLRLSRAMRRDGIDLVHTHLFGDSLHGYLAARSAGGLPVIMTVHNVAGSFTRLQRLGYRWLLPRVAKTVACSHLVRRSLPSFHAEAARRAIAIPNGIEDPAEQDRTAADPQALRRSLGVDGRATLLAGIGRLAAQKNFRHLISAFARLCRASSADLRLVLLGDGPLRGDLESQARQGGVADRVIFAGFRPDVSSLLRAIDVVVFSSLYEGLPVALLESMAAARCIVSYAVPGMLEAIRDDREALIVPIGDVGRLSQALRSASTDASLRARLGEAARQQFLEKFTADAMVQAYQALYREVL